MQDMKNYISTLNLDILKEFSSVMVSQREQIINDWMESPKTTIPLGKLGVSVKEFKDHYAQDIYTYFQSYLSIYNIGPSQTAKKFLNMHKDKPEIIQMFTLICVEFKNKILEAVLVSDIVQDTKLEIFRVFSNILDFNLSLLVGEHSTYMQNMHNSDIRKLDFLEESALVSKTNKFGIITYVSQPLCKAVGFDSKDLVGQKYNLIRHPNVPSRVYKKMWKQLKSGKIWEGRLKNYNANNEDIIFNTKIIPNFDFAGEIIGYTAIKTDLTDKINMGTDKLTGILNRAGFDAAFERAINNNAREYVNLVMIDIDHFKDVNDEHGHVVGDEVLKEFVEVIKKEIRPFDIFARWGGEEFILVISDIVMEDALQVVERIRKAIEKANFPTVNHKTASFGVGSYSDECHSSLEFIEKVDKALYAAKNGGRNKIAYVDEDNPLPVIFS